MRAGESYVLELYMLAWRVQVSGLGDYEVGELELESDGFITSGDTVWLLFRRSAGADEYIGALRQSGIENGLSAEAQALYEAWLEENPGGEGAEIFTPEEVASRPRARLRRSRARRENTSRTRRSIGSRAAAASPTGPLRSRARP